MGKGRTPASSRRPGDDEILLDVPTVSEQDGIRYLHFGSPWVQGAMRIRRPSELVLSYTQQMVVWLLVVQPGLHDRIGILGLGAGSLLRFVMRHTRAQVCTVEHNPQVVAFCRAYFRLPMGTRSQIDLTDAGLWVADPARRQSCRVLMVDLYDGRAQGPTCSGLAFYRHCARVLNDGGVMSVNLFGHHASFAANLDQIQQAFDGRVVCLPEVDEGNTIVLAFKEPTVASGQSFDQNQSISRGWSVDQVQPISQSRCVAQTRHERLDHARALAVRTGLPISLLRPAVDILSNLS